MKRLEHGNLVLARWRRAQNLRGDAHRARYRISARLQRAIVAFAPPDVPRLATFFAPLRGQIT